MVYGMREWRHAGNGQRHYEVLTAKPAQRPCRWIPWEELRKWLLQWQGYTIMRLQLQEPPKPPSPYTRSLVAPPNASSTSGAEAGSGAGSGEAPSAAGAAPAAPPPGIGRRTWQMAERHAERQHAHARTSNELRLTVEGRSVQ